MDEYKLYWLTKNRQPSYLCVCLLAAHLFLEFRRQTWSNRSSNGLPSFNRQKWRQSVKVIVFLLLKISSPIATSTNTELMRVWISAINHKPALRWKDGEGPRHCVRSGRATKEECVKADRKLVIARESADFNLCQADDSLKFIIRSDLRCSQKPTHSLPRFGVGDQLFCPESESYQI